MLFEDENVHEVPPKKAQVILEDKIKEALSRQTLLDQFLTIPPVAFLATYSASSATLHYYYSTDRSQVRGLSCIMNSYICRDIRGSVHTDILLKKTNLKHLGIMGHSYGNYTTDMNNLYDGSHNDSLFIVLHRLLNPILIICYNLFPFTVKSNNREQVLNLETRFCIKEKNLTFNILIVVRCIYYDQMEL